jgi:succinoglycan biosynthesis transport protein ExoP
MRQDSEGFTLEQVLGFLRRRLPLIALCALVAGGAALGLSKRKTKQYTATASIVFSQSSLTQQIAGLSSGGGASSSALLAEQANDLELVKGGDIAAKTAKLLGHGLTARQIGNGLKVAGQGESGVIDVSATSTSPVLAAAIANTYTRQFVGEQESSTRRYFASALAVVNRQLAALSPKQRVGPDGLELQNRAQTLGLLANLNYGTIQIAQEALVPTSPSSPKTSKDMLLGVLLGLLLGLGLALVFEHVDRRIRRPEELQAIYRLPLLGAIPKSAALAQADGRRAALPPAVSEAFNLIRAHLRLFNAHREQRAVMMIASPAAGDGKSTIARQLAEAEARLGSRVLLLEVDLRHPALARQLGIPAEPGLADVLSGALPTGEATQPVELDGPPTKAGTRRTFDVLVAGMAPANTAELLESPAMDDVLSRARSAYDLVVIDTPPFDVVADALSLLTKVDGIVVVGRIGCSRHDGAERLHHLLVSVGAPLVGVVANGSKPGRSTIYAVHESGETASATAAGNGARSSGELVVSSVKG